MFSGKNFQRVCSQTMALFLLSSFSLIYNKNSEQKVEEKDKKNVKTGEEKNVGALKVADRATQK